ncbi:MAG: DUF1538 domain-containing protein [Clostridia bacterium]|nr:DUF1538 domain-containing protein [Clostridia bacterium]
MKTKTILKEKLRESIASILPVVLVILFLSFTVTPLPNAVFISFLFGAFIMIFGMGLFTLGVDKSMTPMGGHVGATITKSKRIWLIVFVALFVGTLITASEPDLTVLAEAIPAIDTTAFILTVSVGVGVFLVFAVLRIIFAIKLRYLLFLSYGLIFILTIFVAPDFLSVAFDAGGVTTGPLTVPFIMAMGVGISSIAADTSKSGDSFGLMALCSAGPIIAVLILGLVYNANAGEYSPDVIVGFDNSREFGGVLLQEIPHKMLEVAKGLFPVVIFFFIFQTIFNRLPFDQIIKLTVGVIYTYVGIILFLTGVSIGFLPVGSYIGQSLGSTEYKWLLIPIGMLLGYFIVTAEPAVHVLEKQVEEVTAGTIPKKMLSVGMSVGVAIAVGLAMLRALTGISILWFVGIGYALALGLSFIVPEFFTSIAFDSGGVASGAMTSTFLMPLAVGATYAVGGDIMTDAFGVIAMVALLPPITIQILGLIYQIRTKRAQKVIEPLDEEPSEIIELEEPTFAAQTPETPAAATPAGAQSTEQSSEIIEFNLP